MDITYVTKRVEEILALYERDPEGAHGSEDAMTYRVLRAIADGHDNPQGLAEALMPLLRADRTRWYA